MAEHKSPSRKRFGVTEVLLIVGIVAFSGYSLATSDISFSLEGIVANTNRFLWGFYFH